MSNKKVEYKNVVELMHIGNETLEWVHIYKYLGIELQSDGNFYKSSDNLCIRGWKAIFKIKSAFKDVDVSPSLTLKLFDILVKPVVCYGSEVWGIMNNLFNSKSLDQFWGRVSELPVEKFQVKYCKGLLGVNCKTNNAAVMGEVGRFPFVICIIKGALKFLKHLKEVTSDRPILNAAMKEDGSLCVGKSWKGRLEKVLSLFGCHLRDDTPMDSVIQHIQKSMKSKYLEYWETLLGDRGTDDGKLYLYRRLKIGFKMEPYLQQIKQFKYRKAISMFRVSAHRLEIETGRWIRGAGGNSISRNDRICTLCFQNGVKTPGDEEHAIMTCPSFSNERDYLLKYLLKKFPNFTHLNNSNKIFFMLTCEGEALFKVSKFLLGIISSHRPSFEKTWMKIVSSKCLDQSS